MPKAKKQKNGSWRCQLWIGEETLPDGKKKQLVKSFTAPTKSEAEDMASEYRRKYGKVAISDLTLSDAISRHIESKSNILSPSTIRSYQSYTRGVLQPLMTKRIKELNQQVVQTWINDQATTYTPKYIKNALALLTVSASAVDPSYHISVSLPKAPRKEVYIPSYNEVMQLIDGASGTPGLKRAIMLSAFGSLRRGEFCALTPDDIDFENGWVSVTKDMVMTQDSKYVIKNIPKTEESYRRVPLPQFVLDELSCGLVDKSPNEISNLFQRLVERLKMPHIRLHDLRHFFASYLHLKGIPDAYIEKYGGWKPGSNVMKEIYRNTINAEESRQAEKIVKIFSGNKKNTRARKARA